MNPVGIPAFLAYDILKCEKLRVSVKLILPGGAELTALIK
jgi:hypothetical protein